MPLKAPKMNQVYKFAVKTSSFLKALKIFQGRPGQEWNLLQGYKKYKLRCKDETNREIISK